MHWLEDKIIILRRLQKLDDIPTRPTLPQTMGNLLSKVRTPAAKIVVRVDRRNLRALGPLFQSRNTFGSRQGESKKRLRARKIKVVNDVNENERVFLLPRHSTLNLKRNRWNRCFVRGSL